MRNILAVICGLISVSFLASRILCSPISFPASGLDESFESGRTFDQGPADPIDVALTGLMLTAERPYLIQFPDGGPPASHDGIRFLGDVPNIDASVTGVAVFVECFRTFKDTIQIIESTTEILEVDSGTAKLDVILRKPAYSGEYDITIHAVAISDETESSPTLLAQGKIRI